MNFKKLIEEGIYSKDMLGERDKTFIKGMEYVRDNVLTKDFIGEGDIDDSFSKTFAKITKEISDNVISTLREYIDIEICEAIVSFCDESEDEEVEEAEAKLKEGGEGYEL